MAFGFLAGAALKLGAKLVRKALSKGAGKRVLKAAGAAALGGAGVATITRPGGQFMLPPPPGRPQMPVPPSRPIARIGQRIIPGGKTGRELTPYGDMVSRQGLPLMVYPDTRERVEAPRGYVIVTHPITGQKLAMLRGAAQRAGLFKARPRPPISAGDAQAIRRAAKAQRRVKKLAQSVGYSCATKGAGQKFGKSKRRKS